jgi:dual specificity tyrosine-phosphorylation-regulated kinase 1
MFIHLHNRHTTIRIQHGETLKAGRYLVHRLIGKGAFGKVIEAFDQQSGEKVAIKIIKLRDQFPLQASNEISILSLLRRVDQDKGFTVRMRDHFTEKGHTCIVFEFLSKTLYDLMREHQFRGLPLSLVRIFAWQLLLTLTLLSRQDVKVIHCDLKPENIMLKSSDRAGIKVVDFGNSCRTGQRMYKYVQSRYYRAPEVLLELTYGPSIDMWSLGCILVELYTGRPLFCGSSKADQVAKITEMLGMPPIQMLWASPKADRYFSLDSTLTYRLKASTLRTSLREIIGLSRLGDQNAEFESFLDLVQQMLKYEPDKRIKPIAALSHKFFDDVNSTQGSGSFKVPNLEPKLTEHRPILQMQWPQQLLPRRRTHHQFTPPVILPPRNTSLLASTDYMERRETNLSYCSPHAKQLCTQRVSVVRTQESKESTEASQLNDSGKSSFYVSPMRLIRELPRSLSGDQSSSFGGIRLSSVERPWKPL